MASDRSVAQVQKKVEALFPELAGIPALEGRLCIDSRQVAAGDIFVALNGTSHRGLDFIPQSIAKGAGLVLLESDKDEIYEIDQVPVIALNHLRYRLGEWLGEAAELKDSALHLIGITGTNGKTSVSHYLARMLEGLQQKAAVIGTVGIGALDNLQTATHTTPDLVQLHQVIADLKRQGFGYQLMEVSSHALDQQRTAGVPFQSAVFTNLSRDHLDYHGTMAAYGATKSRLFTDYPLKRAVINRDDAYGRELLSRLAQEKPAVARYSYSLQDREADLYCAACTPNAEGFDLELRGRWGDFALQLPLLGAFNIGNALAAATLLMASGFAPEQVIGGLKQLQPVAGRMQRFVLPGASGLPQVVVDYAHTPDALKNALSAVRQHLQGDLWCVFGCGGDRDAGKRPLMAEAASCLADQVVVTSDNPRGEEPERILQEVVHGLLHPARLVSVDRAQAIHAAIAEAGADDVILIAGKGHETYQEIQGTRYHFDDAEQAMNALQARAGEKIVL